MSYPKERKSKSFDKGCTVERGREKKKEKRRTKGQKRKKENHFPGFSLAYEESGEEGKRSEKLYLLYKIYRDHLRRSKR